VALATIMAKVTRDTLMETLAQEYPDFGWEKNKGYGTQEHQNAIRHAMHNKNQQGNQNGGEHGCEQENQQVEAQAGKGNQQGGQHHGLSPHHRPFYCKRACIVYYSCAHFALYCSAHLSPLWMPLWPGSWEVWSPPP